jgi:3-methylfumaryl-CoA hydratase
VTAIDVDHLRTWIGRERVKRDDLSPFRAQALAAALDRASGPQIGATLPPAWQWLYFVDTPRASDTGVDGHPKVGDFLPPVPLPRRMWAAGRFVLERPLRLGEVAEQRSVIRAVDIKEGKTGTLVFVTVEHDIMQNGQRCLLEEQSLVYRSMPDGSAPPISGERAPADMDWTMTVEPNPLLLFRYSALTYNGHRIHYDRDYAMRQEHYPALVVHGPLLATLMCELVATKLPEARIKDFQFRAKRPTFDTNAFNVCGKRDGAKLTLWTVADGGFIGMSAAAVLEEGP